MSSRKDAPREIPNAMSAPKSKERVAVDSKEELKKESRSKEAKEDSAQIGLRALFELQMSCLLNTPDLEFKAGLANFS